jgi:uncharacterized repeat protein (TIGR01451 family)
MAGRDRLNGARLALCTGVLAFLLVVVGLRAARPAAAAPDEPAPERAPTADCVDGEQASGARYRICMPDPGQSWNEELVLYAHGYVSYGAPITLPEDQLVVGGVSIPDIITALGYGFATTSYSTNGLAIREGIADLVDLVDVFKTQETTPTRIYLAGASEGGIITALAIETYPDVFDGGLAACGPVGGMAEQVRYFGDFRVVFDYFFPGLMPGDPVSIPQGVIDGWTSYYTEHISPVINSPSSAYSLTQVLDVTGAPYDPADPTTKVASTMGLLWYNVFATNDGRAKLGGQPFDNATRVYVGSADDARLNAQVQRYSADPVAVAAMEAHYRPTGRLSVPLVTIHTTMDEIVPYLHEPLYRDRVAANYRTGFHDNITVERYGHCRFEAAEVLGAFAMLADKVTNPRPDLSTSRKHVVDDSGDGMVQPGEVLSYTITVTNSGAVGAGILLTDALPTGLAYVPDSLDYGFPGVGFSAAFSGNVLLAHTQGTLSPPAGGSLYVPNVMTITFAARAADPLPPRLRLANTVWLRDQLRSYTLPPAVIPMRYGSFMPVVLRGALTGSVRWGSSPNTPPF